MATAPTILFAGGGTGGHIFPNLAVLERLRERGVDVSPHFLVSPRPLDAHMLAKENVAFTSLPAEPLRWRPRGLIRFIQGYQHSERAVRAIIEQTQALAMIATGGFVSGPAVAAAHRAGTPVALVNLDAVPGRSNRWTARHASDLFTVYPTSQLDRAQRIGLPLRRSAMPDRPAAAARQAMGLAPDRPTLFITAGSQGATSINQMMIELCTRTKARQALAGWQVLHLAGEHDRADVQQAYNTAGVSARVEAFCHHMGLAWAAATLAISRAGAGSVAEAGAAGVPTLFLPYPYHRDEHQRFNAEGLVNRGGAKMFKDLIEPVANVNQLMGPLLALMSNDAQQEAMRASLAQHRPDDGADALAAWVQTVTGVRGNF